MNNYILGIVAAAVLTSGFLPILRAAESQKARAANSVSLETLLAEMTDRDATAKWPAPAYTLKQASSYDRATKDPTDAKGWFANQDKEQFIRTEQNDGRHEWVIMEHKGPGAVTRLWIPLEPSRDNQIIRFYFDGSTTPSIAVRFNELLSGRAFVKPPLSFVSWNETDLRHQLEAAPKPLSGAGGVYSEGGVFSVGGDLYLPIPFARSCKITLDQLPFYYIINYRAYEPGVSVDTFSMAGYEAASAALAKAGDMLLAAPDWSVNEPAARATLAPGEELALNLPPGASAVRNLRVQIDPKDAPQVLRSTILLAEFDGEPAIWCPIGEFFGAGARLNPVQDWFRTVQEDGKMFARWVMPYERSARFTLKNHGTNPITVSLAAATSPWKWDDRSLRFHANWRCQNAMKTRPMFDWNYLEIYGRGVYVGDTLTVFSPVSAWYGEGDERVYLDGETLPSHNGTGTEDYYGYAWGMATFFNSPFISMPHRDSKSRESSKGYTTTSRVRLLDGYPLRSSFKLDMEIWHAADTKVDYAVGTFWYARPGATHNRPPQPAEAAQPLAGSATSHLRGAIECETMKVAAKSGDFSVGEQDLEPFGAERWSNGRHLFGQTTAVGDTVEIEWLVSDPAPRKLVLYATQAPDYATLRFQVNGQIVAATFDGYAESVRPAPAFPLGVFTPHDGKFTLRAEVVGANPAAKGRKYFFGLDCVTVEKP